MCVSEGFNITWLGAVRKGLHEDRALELGAKGLAGAHGVKAGGGGACPKKREQALQRPCAHVGKPVRGGGVAQSRWLRRDKGSVMSCLEGSCRFLTLLLNAGGSHCRFLN